MGGAKTQLVCAYDYDMSKSAANTPLRWFSGCDILETF